MLPWKGVRSRAIVNIGKIKQIVNVYLHTLLHITEQVDA